MPTTTDATTETGNAAVMTPYLAVHDGAGALGFYVTAFGAVEVLRVTGDDGRLGHAELTVGPARFFLSDEYPEIGVVGPRTLGGTAVALHLEVPDVDSMFAAAVTAGATSLSEPADQPHGSRHGTLVDPFGHRWMLSQRIEDLASGEYAQRMEGTEWSVKAQSGSAGPEADPASYTDGIWAAVNSRDAEALIGFLVDTFGFEAQLVVPGAEPGVVEHSQLRWPEGGIVQVGTADRPDNVFSQRPVGIENLYVITARPDDVYQRCLAAGVPVVREPSSPDYDPTGSNFTVADPDGNLWTFGTYRGEV
jgi:PhnB protein